MESWQVAVAGITFLAVVALIVTEWMHLTVAALLGAMVLVFCQVMTLGEAIGYIGRSYNTLALFFGVMVLVRAFEPTKIFDYLAAQMVLLGKGQGRNLLLGVVAITTPVCAVLPNATTVMLLAPLIPPLAQDIGVDFVPLLILMVMIANSAGLLTMVGDPATYIVADAINLSFMDYFWRLSLGGAIAIAVIVFMLPFLFPKIWRKKLENLDVLPHPTVNHPTVLSVGIVIVVFVLTMFVVGESLPQKISPAAVALMGATLAMLLSHHSGIDTVNNILRDVDWSTLIFFMSIFVLIGGLEKSGIIKSLSEILSMILGQNILLGSIVLIFFVGLVSSVIPNIPLVTAMVPLLKQYVVDVGLAPADVLKPGFDGQFPDTVLPLFYAMMYGATLGGNGTLVGASANIVAAGIAEQHGRRISFRGFLTYGIPVMLAQLVAVSAFVVVRFFLF
ncbi:MAG: ArsB/NhaD family transporter [Gloeomargarita sp. SKYG116]|nr:ArsB/NhaD family transporter [Gloeomargarita sp. SKYG116]MCS7293619.1 ArsB/NhaD family transporter [Gloeomargarita sp. SKYB120]MDW8179185.1 ArsB/NhaD family transporter [Gloeomargarita sp. SKYBB_i_bin120]MDW8401676.1 ArsB/NhaD family transporter [Gloeomargarita sp. SKYGB_i_bin116]